MKTLRFSGHALLLAAASTIPFAAHAQSAPDQEAGEDGDGNRIVVRRVVNINEEG